MTPKHQFKQQFPGWYRCKNCGTETDTVEAYIKKPCESGRGYSKSAKRSTAG